MKYFNTFNLNINAYNIIVLTDVLDFRKVLSLKSLLKRVMFLGQGSNVLFINDYDGYILINRIKGIKVKENIDFWFLDINSGELLSDVVVFTLNNGIFGLENLSGIPGTIGAAIINNIGAYGLEISNFVYYVKIIDIYTKKYFFLNKKQCCFYYRYSILKEKFYKRFFVYRVGLKIQKKWFPCVFYKDLLFYVYGLNFDINAYDIYNKILYFRKLKIPNINVYGNVGSIFKNPMISLKHYLKLKNNNKNIYLSYIFYDKHFNKVKISAALLIDMCGLKGYTIGGAQIYYKHSLIIINKGWSLPKNILDLIILIKNRVFNKFNILLELEIDIIKSN